MSFGERLKSIRKENKMTQQKFASEFGISQTHVSKLEKEVERPSDTLLKFISYRFAINFDWLKNGTGEKYVQGGASIEGTINRYFLFRQKYETLFSEFNTDEMWEYVDAYIAFVNCSSYAKVFDSFSSKENYLKLLCKIQERLWTISFIFYDENQKKNLPQEALEAKKENCLTVKESIDSCIDQMICDGLSFLADNKNT